MVREDGSVQRLNSGQGIGPHVSGDKFPPDRPAGDALTTDRVFPQPSATRTSRGVEVMPT